MENRNPMIAFFLSFIPGLGFLYIDQKFRGFFYGFTFFAALAGAAISLFIFGNGTLFVIGFIGGVLIGLFQFIDMILFLLKREKVNAASNDGEPTAQSDRFFTMLLSFIPGLGHFHLGLIYRGLSFLIAFFGAIMLVLFIVFFTGTVSFSVFLGVVFVIWIINLVDVVQLLKRKESGENLIDRTILEDLEQQRDAGKKSKAIAILLSVLPGAGHMYLGLQRRGFQLMAAFFLTLYLIDFMRLSFFLFFIPLLWFFSFFDALQKVAKIGEEKLEDVPLVKYFTNYQKWIGIALIFLGVYYLFDRVFLPELLPYVSTVWGIDLHQIYYTYFQTTIISLVFIAGGIKLLFGSKKKGEKTD